MIKHTHAHAIEVNKLTKNFGTFCAVDQLTFKVMKGQIFGFLGPNGAGKSTIIRMLCGLLLPSSGEAIVNGFNIASQYKLLKQHIGYMSQRFSLYNDLTVSENLRFFGGIYGLSSKELSQRTPKILKIVDLTERQTQYTRNLARGLRQRLALALAILHQPKIIFLDEPTSGVDPISRRNFWTIIKNMSSQGTTILVTTHYLDEAEFCDRLMFIYQGRIISQGTPRELKQSVVNRLFSIKPDQLYKGLEIIRALPLIHEANIFGDELHIMIADNNKETSKAIMKILKMSLETAGINVLFLEEISPNLEDAFIAFIKSN